MKIMIDLSEKELKKLSELTEVEIDAITITEVNADDGDSN